jgi:hypothetical protein
MRASMFNELVVERTHFLFTIGVCVKCNAMRYGSDLRLTDRWWCHTETVSLVTLRGTIQFEPLLL